MPSLIDHINDPSLPKPDIEPGKMLEDFTFSLTHFEFWGQGKYAEELRNMSSKHVDSDTGRIAIVVNQDIRELLFSEISQAHLNRMITLVGTHHLTSSAALKEALSSDALSPLVDGTL